MQNGALDFALDVFCSSECRDLQLEVVMLLTRLLYSGNRYTQNHFYSRLEHDHLASRQFLSYLQWLFNYQIDDEFSLERNRHIDITLNLLELMCENSFTAFQNYLRSQASPSIELDTSVNVLEELSRFLMSLDSALLTRITSG